LLAAAAAAAAAAACAASAAAVAAASEAIAAEALCFNESSPSHALSLMSAESETASATLASLLVLPNWPFAAALTSA